MCEPTCDQNPDGSSLDGSSSGGGGGVPIPEGCDPNADPKDAPKCVVSEFGIFVDATTGNDGNTGSKELPMKSITEALKKLNGRPRIYVCEGTYPESVTLTAAVSIYGGFACTSWEYTGVRGTVASASGPALTVDRVGQPVVISDLAFSSGNATTPGGSSIAVLAVEAVSLTLRRAAVSAGTGMAAADAAAPQSNLFSLNADDLLGAGPQGTVGGEEKTCACKMHGSSIGGKGGNAGNPAPAGGAGSATPTPSAMGGRTSAGGAGYPNGLAAACEGGKQGPDGASRDGGAGGDRHGSLTSGAWQPADGKDGLAGNPGAGGGGGGGGVAGGSGGGGCGGCGGAGGKGGRGGGSSIAILADKSSVRLEESTLSAAAGGAGGAGSSGEAGGPGGNGAGGACGGGVGGNGAGGSGGGGGAGGLSVGVLRSGGSIDRDSGTQITPGSAGLGGAFGGGGAGGMNVLGTAPAGNPGIKGKDGVAIDVLEVAP